MLFLMIASKRRATVSVPYMARQVNWTQTVQNMKYRLPEILPHALVLLQVGIQFTLLPAHIVFEGVLKACKMC